MRPIKLSSDSNRRDLGSRTKLVRLAQSCAGIALAFALGVATACGSTSDKGGASAGDAGDSAAEAGSNDGKSGSSNHGGSGGTGGKGGHPSMGDAGEAGEPGGGAGGEAGGGASEPLPEGEATKIGPAGGDVTLTNGTTVTVPANSVSGSTEVTIEGAGLPDSAPGTVQEFAPGFTIDFGGATLNVPAKAKLRLPYKPTEGDLVILVTTDAGTAFVTYTLETVGDTTYAVINVNEGGRYLAVRLKAQPGCDETLASSPTIASQADVEKLSKVRRIVGNLQVSGTGITSLASLKCLQQLDGALVISNTSLTSLKGLDSLTFVGSTTYYTYGVQISSNSLLDTASLPAVLAIGMRQANYTYQSYFQVQSNAVLSEFAADAIESAGLVFTSNGTAATETKISMSALRRAQSLSLQQNAALKNVDGLGAVERVVQTLDVTNNGLTNLDGLESLTSIGDGLNLSNNVALTSVKGLSKLKTVGSISISNNQLLKSVNLAELTAVAQPSTASALISVTQNSGLTEFKADKLAAVTGSLAFSNNGNASVNTVLSLASLASVAGATTISQNLGLQTLDGLKSLTTAANLTIQGNAALQSVSALSALTTVGSLTISSNAKLTEISGFAKLTRIDQSLAISQNALLKTADFPAVATMGGDIGVSNNAALTSFSADALRVAPSLLSLQSNGTAGTPTKLSFAALTSVAATLQISSNAGLVALDGFGALTSVGANVTINGNAALTSLPSLTKLATITGSLTIQQNAALTSVSELTSLNRVTQSVSISNNAALAEITLPALTSAAGVTIGSNAALASITLNALTASSGLLSISSNGSAAAVTTTTISFAALTATAGFQVASNSKLKLLNGFPLLNGVSGVFQVNNNVLLPNCSIVGLRDQIKTNGAISGSVSISGNLVDGCATT
ncbi:MAG TPA: hypothetical protein VFK05_39770 [Polyangiaceae bacterium]|nr:hypothetical protein [Polyangiaceae bacterium]